MSGVDVWCVKARIGLITSSVSLELRMRDPSEKTDVSWGIIR